MSTCTVSYTPLSGNVDKAGLMRESGKGCLLGLATPPRSDRHFGQYFGRVNMV